ncbi:MAG TPA: right-handed parallel beta-helix repeat-containing protein [Verrucomicrobiae bacterium]|nr:right-handed parallel beta-helix repeat-containing protein [Verrucomicrobiae bacterium]
MNKNSLLIAVVSLFAFSDIPILAQGALTPPGAPAPTMKSLSQIEPRTPISSLPFIITNSGSFYLTTNLYLGTGENGISISANDVTIDLNGFTLTGSPAAGSGSGIYVDYIHTNIVVRNGNLEDWGFRGLEAEYTYNSQFVQLRASGNQDDGLDTGIDSTVIQCTAANNVWVGINASAASSVRNCTATDNGNNGISVNAGSVVFGCASTGNGGGISTGTGCTVSACSAKQNGGDGFSISQSTIVDCTAQGNSYRGIVASDGSTVSRCTARVNTTDGILVGTGCQVKDNTCQLNGHNGTGAGIHVYGNESRIEGNHLVSNDYGILVDATNNVVIKNSAQLNTTNYLFTVPQVMGPIIKTADTFGFITNENPWINLSF